MNNGKLMMNFTGKQKMKEDNNLIQCINRFIKIILSNLTKDKMNREKRKFKTKK